MLYILKHFGHHHIKQLVLGPVFKVIEVIFDLFTPLIIARMIDQGIRLNNIEIIFQLGLLLAFMALVGMLATTVCQRMAAATSQGMGTILRSALYQHINRLSALELNQFGTPTLITRLTNDINQIQLAVALGIRQLIRWPFLAVGSVIAALSINRSLGLIVLIATPLIVLVFWLVMRASIPLFQRMQQQLDCMGLMTRESLAGVRAIRAFVCEDYERARFQVAAKAQAKLATTAGILSSVLNPASFLIMNLAICAILWQGSIKINLGELTQGEVIAFVNYMMQTLISVVYVANLVIVFTRAHASATRVREVLDCAPSITSPAHGITEATLVKSDAAQSVQAVPVVACSFNRVSFSFSSAAQSAVSDISFSLQSGYSLGIIGGTGSGKSTLVSLLLRLYDANKGEVLVAGHRVKTWDVAALRHYISYVPQRAVLMSGSIRTNLCWRKSDASDEELWQALNRAQAADFVHQLPEGLDAPVEAGGNNFSGGQRQRLTIARALVDAPQILILDDASSALDAKTDAALREAIRELGITTIWVSQRVSAVRHANTICVMRRGRAVGIGTHEQLVTSCAVYQEICTSQGIQVPNVSLCDAALEGDM
ncbi:ABC transporter ATP-binding protein/permease [Collinsella sp. zg1085]|uniref:ABC transporter ATP-binding protein n=1 Tax=Collinsella sp. zg1085 TaxID=2844380 RepID=UPI001C0BA9F0|nr:ABC transporter ATP-binding protein [Collinsella sp. zg1085]QWT18076.1 ABC transporter ATP-binding protein/permease [Collinsella sp. zg1085]